MNVNNNELPDEKTFIVEYGISFSDAWVATFVLSDSD
jgi:hypothetical protein